MFCLELWSKASVSLKSSSSYLYLLPLNVGQGEDDLVLVLRGGGSVENEDILLTLLYFLNSWEVWAPLSTHPNCCGGGGQWQLFLDIMNKLCSNSTHPIFQESGEGGSLVDFSNFWNILAYNGRIFAHSVYLWHKICRFSQFLKLFAQFSISFAVAVFKIMCL